MLVGTSRSGWEVFLPPGGRVGPMRWPCILGFWRAPLPAGILALPAWLSWRLRWDKEKRSVQKAFFLTVKRGIGRGVPLGFPLTKVCLRTPQKRQGPSWIPDIFWKNMFWIYPQTPVTVITNWWHYNILRIGNPEQKPFIRKPGILGTPQTPMFFYVRFVLWQGGSSILRTGGFRFQPYISYTRLQGLAKNKARTLDRCENGTNPPKICVKMGGGGGKKNWRWYGFMMFHVEKLVGLETIISRGLPG